MPNDAALLGRMAYGQALLVSAGGKPVFSNPDCKQIR